MSIHKVPTVAAPATMTLAAAIIVVASALLARGAAASLTPQTQQGQATASACSAPTAGAAPAQGGVGARSVLGTTGNVFVSHGGSAHVSILSLATGEVTTLPTSVGETHEVGVSPDGRWGVAADFGDYKGNYEFDGRRLVVIDIAAKRVARVIDLGPHRGPHDIRFLAGGSARAVVTTQTTREVVEVDIAEGRVIGATPTGAVGSHTLAVAADGRTAVTANEGDGSVSRLDLVGRTLLARHAIGRSRAEGIAITPDGREAWVSFPEERLVRVIDTRSGKVLATLSNVRSAVRMTISGDGRKAAITDVGCRELKVFDVATRRLLGAIGGLRENPGLPQVLPDNRTAIVPLLSSGEVVVVDLDELRVLARHRAGRRIDGAVWGPEPRPATP